MRNRLVIALTGLALAGLGIGLSACGGSSTAAAGTVEHPITVGTGDNVVDPSGGGGATAPTTTGGATAPTTTGGATAPAGDAAAGKAVFTANCGACHTLKDAGTAGTVGPNLDQSTKAKDAAAVVAQVTNGRGLMPAFKGKLSDADIANVAAYVASVSGK